MEDRIFTLTRFASGRYSKPPPPVSELFQSFAHFLLLPIETETGIRQRQSILLWQMSNDAENEGQGSHRTDGAGRILAPVGRWGKEGSSLRPQCRSEGRTQATEDAVSTPILFNPAAEAAVSLLGGAAGREETFEHQPCCLRLSCRRRECGDDGCLAGRLVGSFASVIGASAG